MISTSTLGYFCLIAFLVPSSLSILLEISTRLYYLLANEYAKPLPIPSDPPVITAQVPFPP